MTAMSDIKATAYSAATGALHDLVEDVRIEPKIGWDGDEILEVMIVLKEGAIDQIDGDRFVKTLMSIKRNVGATGDPRMTLVTYATRAELAEDGDPES